VAVPVRASLTRGITRNVVLLGIVSLLTDVSSELLIYVIPLFLANVLIAAPTVIGIIDGLAESVAAFAKLGSGALADRIGRRTILVGSGYGVSVVAKTLYLVAVAWPLVLVARVGDRIGKGIRTAPRDALIADSIEPGARGRAFGLHRAMDTAGAVLGVALAALIVEAMQGDRTLLELDTFRTLALAALVPALLGLAVLVAGVRDVPRPPRAPAPGSRATQPQGSPQQDAFPRLSTMPPSSLAWRRGLPPAFWIFVAASGLFTLGNSSDAFIALRSQAIGVSVRDLLLVIIAFNVVEALVSWPAGTLSDRIGRRRLLAIGWGIYAATYAGFALAGSAPAVVALWLLYGAYYGVNDAVGRALVADLAPAELRATAYGILNAITGLALLPASIVAGLLWDAVGQAAPFWFGALCAAGGLGLLALVRPGPSQPAGGSRDAGRVTVSRPRDGQPAA
jgi:MFS family permease